MSCKYQQLTVIMVNVALYLMGLYYLLHYSTQYGKRAFLLSVLHDCELGLSEKAAELPSVIHLHRGSK